ncbi:hypothetical protein ACEPPN_002579 [Leptodophora sp. 'Broadleaf-Isolate-01']
MSAPADVPGSTDLEYLRKLGKDLQNIQTSRLQEDFKFATKAASEYETMLEKKNNRVCELKVDQTIRRGEETVRVWRQNSIPFGPTQNGARVMREETLNELAKLEEKERADLQGEFLRLELEYDTWKEKYITEIEQKRQAEDLRLAEIAVHLSGGIRHPKNLNDIISELDGLIANQLSRPVTTQSPAVTSMDHARGSGIDFDRPTIEMYGMKTIISAHGLLTPDNTPPSSNEPRFGALQPPATPTPASRKSLQASSRLGRRDLPAARKSGSASTSSTTRTVLPLTGARVSVTVSGFRGQVKEKVVVIDLISDSEDELPRRTIRPSDSTPLRSREPSTPSKIKPPTTKKVFKKPVQSIPSPSAPSPNFANANAQFSFRLPASDSPLSFKNATKALEKVVESTFIRDTSPGIFDTDSDYTESESRKRRRATTSETPRTKTGATTMGDLLERPGSRLSAKGLPFWKWARLVYYPKKLLKFSVAFIWAYKENGELSTFNDRTSLVGMYYHRLSHTLVPVIGHARKEDVHPEFVLEEDEMTGIQYNSENSLACVTRSVGVHPDVVIKFVGRDDLWNFLVIAKDIMDIQVSEK